MPGRFRNIRANVDGRVDDHTAASLVYPNIPESSSRANLLIEAHNFSQNETTLTKNATKPGSYLTEASSGFGDSISSAGKTYMLAGSNVIFSITPADNYKVLEVLVDGNPVGPVPPISSIICFPAIVSRRVLT